MAKYTPTTIANISGAEATAITNLNNNFTAIATAFENTLSRDGTTPNSMSADIDLNSNDLLNVATIGATTATITGTVTGAIGSFTRLIIDGTEQLPTGVPSGGTVGQVLSKASGDDYDAEWTTISGTGTVTSVAVSATDGLEVDSGSPITTSGTITLGVNAASLLAHLGVEANADVTDTANVTAAGALMDSEVTNLADVKAFDPSDYAAASHTHDHTEVTDYDTELAGTTNTTAFTPTADYHPATKKYVDDEIVAAGGYNDESAQDAIGTILVDSSEINFTYNDSTPSITADLVTGSIDETKLDTSVNASLDLADSAQQPPSEGAFVDGDKTKLDGISSGADVTQAAISGATTLTSPASLDEFVFVDNDDSDNLKIITWTNVLAAIASATQTLTNKTLGAVTLSGLVSGADQQVERVELKDFSETVNAIGSIGGGTQDIDLEDGNFVTATVDTSTTTFTFSNPSASGKACSFTLELTNGGSQTVNWPTSVKWGDAGAPVLTSSGLDTLEFVTTNGGTDWRGYLTGTGMEA